MASTKYSNRIQWNNKIPEQVCPGGDQSIHFIGLGGIGMSGIAQLLLEMGYKVSGSDLKDSPVIYAMTNYGAITFIGHHEQNLQNAGLVVVSSAIKGDNPEYNKAVELGLPIIHRAEILSALMIDARQQGAVTIGITGTHGKTTTTGMIGMIFEDADLLPTIVVGGIMPHINSNSRLGSGKCFIAELDESDGTIALYTPCVSVITNLELDHVDYYTKGVESLIQTFQEYVGKLPPNSKLVANVDCGGVVKLLETTKYPHVVTYSVTGSQADYKASDITFEGDVTTFNLYQKESLVGKLSLQVHGRHNVSNALASVVTALENNIDFSVIQSALAQFSGMKRRFQHITRVKGADIIDDYAHHPTEIMATIATAKEIVRHRGVGKVKVIFQPHRYSRVKTFWNDFKQAFCDADKVYITDVYGAGESSLEGISGKDLVQAMGISQVSYVSGTMEDIAPQILPDLAEHDLVITMGAGDITKLGHILASTANGV